jgi:transcriptional regulator with XRE-family HTH domain
MGKKKNEGTINERVKIVRKDLKLTQQEFAKKLMLTHGQISVIELGKGKITERNISQICTPNLLKEGKQVSYLWLKYGDFIIDKNGKHPQSMFITPATADGSPNLYDEDKKRLPPDEEELIGVYRDLIPINKQHVRDNAKMILKTQEDTIGEVEKGEKDRQPEEKRKSG